VWQIYGPGASQNFETLVKMAKFLKKPNFYETPNNFRGLAVVFNFYCEIPSRLSNPRPCSWCTNFTLLYLRQPHDVHMTTLTLQAQSCSVTTTSRVMAAEGMNRVRNARKSDMTIRWETCVPIVVSNKFSFQRNNSFMEKTIVLWFWYEFRRIVI
jgi:hypothetical protein